jgi:hypothetical protein
MYIGFGIIFFEIEMVGRSSDRANHNYDSNVAFKAD